MSRDSRHSGARSVVTSLIWLLAVAAGSTVHAQTSAEAGTISGRVVNAATGLAVPGAKIALADPDTSASAVSDLSGNFVLERVPAGRSDLTVSKDGFQTAAVTGVNVAAGEIARLDLPMSPSDSDALVMEAYTVSADIIQNSGVGLLVTRQRSVSVSDAIASDEMSRLGIGDAAEALAKTPGTTILDGKYAVIRGLGDRYTNTQMNGLTVPTADPDKRAVQMDQFPSDLIDSVTTLKSFTPDQPGAFSGGSVNMKTKSFPELFFFSASVETAYNTNVTGEDILSVPGGGKDWQGRDDGTRGLSAAVPNPMPANLTTASARIAARQGNFEPAQQLDAISKGFHNEVFFPRPKKADPDFGFSAALGDSLIFRNDQVFGYIASLTYKRTTEHFSDGITGRYRQGSTDPQSPDFVDLSRVFTPDLDEYHFAELYRANPDVPGGPPAFGVTESSENVDWGAYLQLAWRPTYNHELTTTFFHNQSASDRVKRGVGEAVRSDSGTQFRESYDLLYTERGVSSVQLAGKSNLPAWNDATIEWRVAASRSTQDQPDYRTFEFKWDFSQQAFDPSGIVHRRYFRELEEDSTDLGLDFTRTYSFAAGRELTMKLGGAWFDSERTNRERAFLIDNVNTRTREAIESFPGPIGIVDQTDNSVTFGTVMREISANLKYDGEQTFSAGYLMGDFRWNDRWRVVGGARLERTEILTTPRPDANITPRLGEIEQTDALPSLALIWSPWKRQNIRLSYGRTLARPTFREMADVVGYDAFTDQDIGGNPDLEMTVIDNVDLRWEWFPRGGEVLAASVFYKRLDKPIEYRVESGRIFPDNVEDGVVYGLEIEARRKLDFIADSLENLSIGFNASLIESEVTISQAELDLIRAAFPDASDKRELFGQSKYIVNFDATQRVPSWGSSFTAVFGVFGERLDLVATGALPDVYEQPAPALDFIWTQRLTSRWKLKFSAKNLLDPDREKTLEYNGTTYFYERYTRGRTFSIKLSYDFN